MTGKTYAVLGGGGSFGIHTALYLLHNANPKKVIGIGRSPLKPEPFSLSIDRQPNFEYHSLHITYELDLLLDLLDKEQPQVIVNFAAQGESAVSWKHSWRFFETNSVALARLCEELMMIASGGSPVAFAITSRAADMTGPPLIAIGDVKKQMRILPSSNIITVLF